VSRNPEKRGNTMGEKRGKGCGKSWEIFPRN